MAPAWTARDRAFNLTWHDWLNLKSQLLVSRAIVAASEAREESRGAHWREDFPQTDDDAAGLAATIATLRGRAASRSTGRRCASRASSPGESLLTAAAE